MRTHADSNHVIVFVDECHIHQEVDLGRSWFPKGRRYFVATKSPGLFSKQTFYGAYSLNDNQVTITPYPRGNAECTEHFVKQLRAKYPSRDVTLIWDGAAYHRSPSVISCAQSLGIQLMPLPGYSPDLMPVEALWKWLRECTTYNRYHASLEMLREAVSKFEEFVNASPHVIKARLKPKESLDPREESHRTGIPKRFRQLLKCIQSALNSSLKNLQSKLAVFNVGGV